MVMKHSISGAILGAALATSSPQASSQHAELMTDTRREYTELMDGHPSNITVGAGTSQYGTGIHLEATHGTNHMIFGVRAEVYEDAKRALGALGFRFTESVDGVITVGYTSVNADKALQDDRFSGKLRASSIGASVFYHTDIATAFLRFIQENGKNTNNLYEASSSTTEITTSEFATFIRETMIRTTTHEMYSWEGIERRRATIGGIIPLGDNQEISIEAGASKDPLRGTKAYTRTEYTLYG